MKARFRPELSRRRGRERVGALTFVAAGLLLVAISGCAAGGTLCARDNRERCGREPASAALAQVSPDRPASLDVQIETD